MAISLETIEDTSYQFLIARKEENLDRSTVESVVSKVIETFSSDLKFSNKDISIVVKMLLERLEIDMVIGSFIASTKYKPWLDKKRIEMENNGINWRYTKRYKRLLDLKKFSKNVINTIDIDTDNILNLTEDPNKDGSWSRKGLVVGHVQSGKTANYTGLICKAADAGYKIIIILAGMSNDLRNQTQRRADEGFVGLNTGRLTSGANHNQLLTGVGEIDKALHAETLTTSEEDFNKNFAKQFKSLSNSQEPFLAVIKKNKYSFENLINWLTAVQSNFNDIPLLLIDDEADHASINTNKEHLHPTTINKCIQDLLEIFPKNAYVGYTATPFANVFINPDPTNIFPEDFIYSLSTPSNYIGPEQVFGSIENLNIVRTIPETEYKNSDGVVSKYIPLKHKKDLELKDLPPSLKEAIYVFILTCSERNLRGQKNQHKSMMINVSVNTDVQHAVRLLVYQFIVEIKEAVNVNFALEEKALNNTIVKEFHRIYKKEFSNLNWNLLLKELNTALEPLKVIEINTGDEGESLSYDSDIWPNGRTVIAIGGYSLSRGLTLEGLTTSYLLRNTKMYDTLMQMGRWFGYRKGYEDICRIYLHSDSIDWYEFITNATAELREEFVKMRRAGLTPGDFGLRVQMHPASLLITAQNKMRSGKIVIDRAVDLKGSLIETHTLSAIKLNLSKNFEAANNLISGILENHKAANSKSGYLFNNVSFSEISTFINSFVNHPYSHLTESLPIKNYIEEIATDGVDKWNVLLVNETGAKGDIKQIIGGLEVKAGKRSVSAQTEKFVKAKKQVFTSVTWEHAVLDKEIVNDVFKEYKLEKIKNPPARAFIKKMTSPFLKIFLINCEDDQTREKISENGFIGWSISFPGSMKSKEDRFTQYVQNVTMQQQDLDFSFDDGEDDYE